MRELTERLAEYLGLAIVLGAMWLIGAYVFEMDRDRLKNLIGIVALIVIVPDWLRRELRRP